jgi:hypothetical protein
MADSLVVIPKTELARNTRKVINTVLRGRPALVESYGQPEVAILDVIDYYLVRAALRYFARMPVADPEAGLSDAELAAETGMQARFDLALARYLSGAISLGRAAEVLGLSWLDLRARLGRLDVPIRAAPSDAGGAQADAEAAEGWPAGRP